MHRMNQGKKQSLLFRPLPPPPTSKLVKCNVMEERRGLEAGMVPGSKTIPCFIWNPTQLSGWAFDIPKRGIPWAWVSLRP